MHSRRMLMLGLCAMCLAAAATGQPARAGKGCARIQIEGQLHAGESFSHAIGSGLKVYFQPIQSGWILRVLPVAGPAPDHDFAELATPPYESVNPLSISTDFAFRSQDAVGWNPRRFRFATSASDFERLHKAWLAYEHAGANPPAPLQLDLSSEIARAAEGSMTIVDARLIPGTADQWKMAAAVASHFSTTAHTLEQEEGGRSSPLGRLIWIRFRLDLEEPGAVSHKGASPGGTRPCPPR